MTRDIRTLTREAAPHSVGALTPEQQSPPTESTMDHIPEQHNVPAQRERQPNVVALWRVLLIFAVVQTLMGNLLPETRADELLVAPLTDDDQQALQTIQERDVRATISFLASDEMAGRDTPSRELNIASAFVAARFRGAGLEGLGPDGHFYQTTQLTRTAPAASGLAVAVNGVLQPSSALLMGLDTVVSIEGPLQKSGDNPPAKGAIILDDINLPPQAIGKPLTALVMWSRRVAPLTKQGVTAVLIRASADSPLREVAARLVREPVTLPPQFAFACPVILVDPAFPAEGRLKVTVPANQQVAADVHNVIGVLRGSDPVKSREAIIITAHLDHIGLKDSGEDLINNGADDNATGVTAVLTLADAFGALQERPARSVIFMTFWGEEQGLLGSKYYVQHPLWPLDEVVANVNIEMIGRPEDGAEGKVWGTGWTHSDLGPLMALGASRSNVTFFHHPQFSQMLYARSDNFSFVSAGVIAHSFSAGSLHSDYHQPSDEIDKLNLSHMTRVIQGLFAATLPIAQGQVTPRRTPPEQVRP